MRRGAGEGDLDRGFLGGGCREGGFGEVGLEEWMCGGRYGEADLERWVWRGGVGKVDLKK